jgi:hypothetical protein
MKRLFAIFLVTVLTSCGASLEPPKSNTDYKNIIGKPVKIGNLEIAQYDFQKKLFWDDAKKACDSLGEGWRLPTKDELNVLYENKDKIGGFSNSLYWSSTERDNNVSAWFQFFNNGLQWADYKLNILSVRAVRVK